jgi:glycosyltransferase involved in cell wall biosynthesis
MTRVLINALHARAGGGITYLRNLLPILARQDGLEVHLLLHDNQKAVLAPFPEGVPVHSVGFKDGFLGRLIWEQLHVPGFAKDLQADVVFSPANFGPLLARRSVVLLRNALSVGGHEDRLGKRIYWMALGVMTTSSLLVCRRAIAVSDYARRELTRGLAAVARSKVEVVPHGVSSRFAPPASPERDGFMLAVGDIYIQKNYHRLVAAVGLLKREFPDVRLKIAGNRIDPDYAASVEAEIARSGLGDRIEFLGPVDVATLARLYQTCGVFVFPSVAETFGNPLVEAMASGAPIASSNTTAMPEVLGEAGLYFDPLDPAMMAATIAEALRDPALRKRLSEAALKRASRYSWEETARRTADVLRKAAGED